MNDSRERRPFSFGAVARAGLLLALLLAFGVWLSYRAFIRYEPRAQAHLPSGAELVVVADLEQVIVFEPVRKHLLPLLEQWPFANPRRAHDSGLGRRSAQLREQAGLNLGLDLREIAFASLPSGWVLALGGLFPEQGLLEGIEAVLRAENVPGLEREGETLAFEPSGVALARAADGVLLIASNRALLEAAVSARAEHGAINSKPMNALPPGPLRVRATPAFLLEYAFAEREITPLLRGLERFEVKSRFENGIQFEVSLGVAPGADTQRIASELESWLSRPGNMTGWAGGLSALAHAQVVKIYNKNIVLITHWNIAELDRAAFELGAWLRNRLERSMRPSSDAAVVGSP